MDRRKVGVAGSTGYLGAECVRILASHPGLEPALLCSTSAVGRPYSDVNPAFQGVVDQPLAPLSAEALARMDAVLLATPHGVAARLVPDLLDLNPELRIVDLSGDHRLQDAAEAERAYGHAPAAAAEAVYGLPEVHRARIREARLVANPGCYPTASVLAALPLLEAGVASASRVIVDAKSGVSGAGREPGPLYHYPEANENLRAYKVGRHRHEPEIAQALGAAAGSPARVTFTPHLVPMNRGILATVYLEPEGDLLTADEVRDLTKKRYADEPFVRVAADPNVAAVRGSNLCDVAVVPTPSGLYVGLAAIDNLVKGGAGQAVQNLNLMLDLPETAGLPLLGAAL